MDKLKESQLVRDWLEHQIKELKQIKDSVLQDKAVNAVTKTAMFKLANIWLGDIKK